MQVYVILMKELKIKIRRELKLEDAEKYAKAIASKYGDAMLLSFCDRKSGFKVPDVDCCGEDSWEIYGKTRGGNLKIKINEFEFVFRVE
jgi:hypothetical protein